MLYLLFNLNEIMLKTKYFIGLEKIINGFIFNYICV